MREFLASDIQSGWISIKRGIERESIIMEGESRGGSKKFRDKEANEERLMTI